MTFYQQALQTTMASSIGKGGLEQAAFEAQKARLSAVRDRIISEWKAGSLPLLSVPAEADALKQYKLLAERIKRDYTRLIVVGTGGSSLGAKVLTLYAEAEGLAGLPVEYIENVDPLTVKNYQQQDLRQSFILLVSKSGGTLETLSVGMVLMQRLEQQVGRQAFKHQVAVVTQPGDSALRKLAETYELPLFEHPADVGGRYSVLTVTGMIPALVAGLDAAAVRRGAQAVIDAVQADAEAAPLLGSAMQKALMEQGMCSTVMMPYCDRLFEFGAWFRQLWAESLGKEGKGTVPVRSLGAIDQHSQLQLYLDGPNQSGYTILCLKNADQGPALPLELLPADKRPPYLQQATIGDLLDAMQQGTIETLASRGRPVRVIEIPALTPECLGALLMHFMLETIATAYLMGIDPYDQPAVEDAKNRARAALEARQKVAA